MKLANDEADIDACDMMRKRTAGVRIPRAREGERGAVLVPSSRASPVRRAARRKNTYVGGGSGKWIVPSEH